MTSTTSLAARICSSVAGAISPAMPQAWPKRSSPIKHIVNVSLVGANHRGAAQTFIFRRRCLDQEHAQIIRNQSAGERLSEELVLDDTGFWEICAAVEIFLVFDLGLNFFGS